MSESFLAAPPTLPDDSVLFCADERSLDELAGRDLGNTPEPLTMVVDSSGDARVVRLAGQLDVASCGVVKQWCVAGGAGAVIVDLSDLTFLDCGGYGALLAARTELEQHHRTLTLIGAVGEPRRLLDLIRQLEESRPDCDAGVVLDSVVLAARRPRPDSIVTFDDLVEPAAETEALNSSSPATPLRVSPTKPPRCGSAAAASGQAEPKQEAGIVTTHHRSTCGTASITEPKQPRYLSPAEFLADIEVAVTGPTIDPLGT